ncbi:flavin reductase family protein [uncultured Thiodictyon sp.]|uniref:flavin reductase family protein n=1 Tax=uncultured Thiodictyon sp. TaxID=1846217 RepID=UPI002600EB5C|nr:flavin reductase family protein [uncultured Thiodictyon sp.]
MTPEAITAVFHLYDVPLWLVTASHAGRRGGLIATSAVRASIVAELPRMLIAIARRHHTWGLIEGSGRFALHLLPGSALEAVWHFGLQSGHQVEKFADLPALNTPDGNPRHPGCAAWLDCRVEERLEIGDRSIYLAQVTGGEVCGEAPVLGVADLLRAASPAQRATLDRLYALDAASDAAAIRAWRQAQGLA